MTEFEQALDGILARDTRFGRDAYLFLREALEKIRIELVRSGGTARHVSAPELLESLRDLALTEFGPMAWTVLDDWGVHSCPDWGEIVFNLIEQQVLTKTDSDSKSDFQGGYDFHEAFRRPFQRLAPASSTTKNPD